MGLYSACMLQLFMKLLASAEAAFTDLLVLRKPRRKPGGREPAPFVVICSQVGGAENLDTGPKSSGAASGSHNFPRCSCTGSGRFISQRKSLSNESEAKSKQQTHIEA